MKVTFPHVDHRKYPRTFLDLAVVQIHFTSPKVLSFIQGKDFFVSVYGLDFNEERYNQLRFKTLRISSDSLDLQLKFSVNFIQLEIGQKGYSTFSESVVPHISNFLKYIRLTNGRIDKISIRKVDSWGFLKPKNESYYSLVDYVIQEHMVSHFPKDGVNPEDEMIISTIMPHDDKEAVCLNFGYTTVGDDPQVKDQKMVRVILDTEYVAFPETSVYDRNIVDSMCAMNQVLFNVFHWAVKPEVIFSMDHADI